MIKKLFKFIFLVILIVVISVICSIYAKELQAIFRPILQNIPEYIMIAINWIKNLFTKKETQAVIQAVILR